MQGNAELWAKGIASLVRDHVERATAPLREEIVDLRDEASANRIAIAEQHTEALRDDVKELQAREIPDPEAFVERLANALTARLIA